MVLDVVLVNNNNSPAHPNTKYSILFSVLVCKKQYSHAKCTKKKHLWGGWYNLLKYNNHFVSLIDRVISTLTLHSTVSFYVKVSSSERFLCKRFNLRAVYLCPYLEFVTSPSLGCLCLAGLGGHWNLLTICLLKYTMWIWLDVRDFSVWADIKFTVTFNHLADDFIQSRSSTAVWTKN